MKNVFIAGPSEISLFHNNTLVSVSKTMLNNSIAIETSSEDIRGGFGALLLGKYFHSSNMTMELEDSMFRMEWVKYATGAAGSIGSDVLSSETITLGEDLTAKIKGVPAPIGDTGKIVGWIETTSGSFDEVEVTSVAGVNTITYTLGTAGAKYCFKYYTYNADANVLTISANIIPDELRAVAKCQLFAGSKGAMNRSSRIGFVYIEIPRFLLNGGTSISLTHTGASTSPLSGSALATDSPDGCDEGGYYAHIIKVEEGAKWYDNAYDIAIVDDELAIKVTETATLDVRAYGSMFVAYKPAVSELTFTSKDPAVALVSDKGVVTGIVEGTTTIEVVATAKPTLKTIAVVTVETKA